MVRKLFLIIALFAGFVSAQAWPGMEMPKLHIEGRWLMDENGNRVNLHGFGQTYSPWFNEMGSKWSNYDVQACLKYNKDILDGVMDRAGWKADWLRMHMDPYWSNTPGVHTEGENDISAFDFNRFRTYLNEVFIPMAEYAISKGLYVVMRPPGVCPHNIAINDAYHKYLKRVWGYISTQKRLTENPYIMFELANEPVNIMDTDGEYRSNTDGCNKNLSQFFQEIVDLMRGNGCENILWVPGTGYQSQYAGFAKYPIKGDNIGYAVHVYPGWYGSDALEPSHELGGGYGGHFDAFAAGWAAQIKPAAEIAPILVTEMDWAPSVYEKSWGRSITGKMLGQGFGGNFKILADNTENVSWMIFTGPELMAKFRDEPGKAGSYTFFNDPDACVWPAYQWYKEYAGEKLSTGDAKLCLSPRSEENKSEYVVMTGGATAAALISEGEGFELNHRGIESVEFTEPGIMDWEDGFFYANGQGTTDCTINYVVNGEKRQENVTFTSTAFPMTAEMFNPSIWETGSFDPQTGMVKTGTYGFAGWKYTKPLDLSDYDYLIAEIKAPQDIALSFRVYDKDNYWTSPAIVDFHNNLRVALDLKNMKDENGNKLDRSHLYYVGFWSLGSRPFLLKNVFAANDPNANAAVDVIEAEEGVVDVFNMQGVRVRRGVERGAATEGLPAGVYIVGGDKVIVR